MKTWTDQPDEVAERAIVATLHVGDFIAEVRWANDNGWYITTGTLFGSQTLLCRDAETAFRVFEALSKGTPTKPPSGARLVT